MGTSVENGPYPYIPGKYGLPFNDLEPREGKFPLLGGSGQIFHCTAEPNRLMIQDRPYDKYFMIAQIQNRTATGQTLFLDLKTRHTPAFGSPEKQVDMRAGAFFRLALQYFERQGVHIESFMARWEPFGDNFWQFVADLTRSGDKKHAAESTWSGKTAQRNGFVLPDSSYVTAGLPQVKAIFINTAA